MATLTIKNVPEALVDRLKTQAARHRRSLDLEVIACLETAAGSTPVDVDALLARLRQVRVTPRRIVLTDRLVGELKGRGRR